jgi:hypothetical protein
MDCGFRNRLTQNSPEDSFAFLGFGLPPGLGLRCVTQPRGSVWGASYFPLGRNGLKNVRQKRHKRQKVRLPRLQGWDPQFLRPDGESFRGEYGPAKLTLAR